MEPRTDLTQHRDQHPGARVDTGAIQGWGADLDRKNRPAVPMERMPARLPVDPTPPVQQARKVEVFVSPERPHVTPLFGTSAPPKGVSGAIRRLAYKLTENDIRHWLLLMVADRVNVIEGIGDDLSAGRVPNLLTEMGVKAEWQHNRSGLVTKVAVVGAVAGIAWYVFSRRNNRH